MYDTTEAMILGSNSLETQTHVGLIELWVLVFFCVVTLVAPVFIKAVEL